MSNWQPFTPKQPSSYPPDQITEWSIGVHHKVELPGTAPFNIFDMSTFDAVLLRVHVSWILRALDPTKPPIAANLVNPQVWPLEDFNTKPLVLTACSAPISDGVKLGFAGRAQIGGNFFRPSRRLAPDQQSDYFSNEKLPNGIFPALGSDKAYQKFNPPVGGLFADIYAHARARPEVLYDFGGIANETSILRVNGLPPIGDLHFFFNFLDGQPFICNYYCQLYGYKAIKGGPP